MGSGASMLRAFLLLLDVGGAPVLATGKSAEAEIDIKYAIIGTALGVAISAVFLVLKICMIRKHLFDIDSSDLRSTNPGFNDTITLKKRVPRSNLSFSESYSCTFVFPYELQNQLQNLPMEQTPFYFCWGCITFMYEAQDD
ncbi:transmembrane protein 273 [Mirounga leonina]|uniref:transmembrane protein 273 n=1 Tax=Mirounga leonina TaxID=9715 RepID=UPI00156C3D5A|nr:transmembrane protein 273 [Mirounga leonina]